MTYKTWPTEQIISTGKRLKYLLNEMQVRNLTLNHLNDYIKGRETLNALRNELKLRKYGNPKI